MLVRIHNAEAVRFFHWHGQYRDGRDRLLLDVEVQHRAVIHLVDMVAGENQHIVRVVLVDKFAVLVDRVRRAGVPAAVLAGLVRRQHKHAAVHAVEVPVLAGANVAVQRERAILREHADRVDVRIDAVAERKIDDAILAAKRHGGFRHAGGQHAEAAALSARQQHGYDLFLHALRSS
ncbi:hypothetical protein SDC9_179879 [bioreactor metagenome]|uniref:Uncharacterized protein n=1 Tax=bioreactor metagenome TaxID=1076179 RepID=A0A645H024_9ZZZZ